MVRAIAYDKFGPGSNPGVHTICGQNLLLVHSFAARDISQGTRVYLEKNISANSTGKQVNEEQLRGCVTSKSLFIFLFINKNLFSVLQAIK